jgi:hypothetical protein
VSALAEKLPDTNERVELHTAPEVNKRIRQQTEANVAGCAGAGREVISDRLRAIEREWDMERTLEVNAATVVLLGVTLGPTRALYRLFVSLSMAFGRRTSGC